MYHLLAMTPKKQKEWLQDLSAWADASTKHPEFDLDMPLFVEAATAAVSRLFQT